MLQLSSRDYHVLTLFLVFSVIQNRFILRIIMVIRGQHATPPFCSQSLWLLGVSMLQQFCSQDHYGY